MKQRWQELSWAERGDFAIGLLCFFIMGAIIAGVLA